MKTKLKNDKKLIEKFKKNRNRANIMKSLRCQKLEKWWKWENWNEAVWDAIGTASKPEKMFWTAEIELYRWVMSNGPYGYNKIEKRSVCFWILRPVCQRVIVNGRIFGVFASAEALKNQISLSKINFYQNFDQKHFLFFVILDNFCGKRKKRFAQKWTKKINCHQNVKKTCLGILFLMFFE